MTNWLPQTSNDGGIYEHHYEIAIAAGDNNKAAEAALREEGRKKMPDDVGLMFKEINHYIKQGRLDLLVDKLKKAIEKGPITCRCILPWVMYTTILSKDSMFIKKDAKEITVYCRRLKKVITMWMPNHVAKSYRTGSKALTPLTVRSPSIINVTATARMAQFWIKCPMITLKKELKIRCHQSRSFTMLTNRFLI